MKIEGYLIEVGEFTRGVRGAAIDTKGGKVTLIGLTKDQCRELVPYLYAGDRLPVKLEIGRAPPLPLEAGEKP